MTRIGGGGRPPEKTDTAAQQTKTGESHESVQKDSAPRIRDAAGKQVVDHFERAAPQITQQLKAMAGKKALAPSIQFTSEHLAELAQAFAGMLRKKPGADRRERARMFARAILRSRKFGKIFDEADEAELESLYQQIAGQLDGSPVLAQLVDDVTEGARKMSVS